MSPVPAPTLPEPAAINLALESHTIRGAMRGLHAELRGHRAVLDQAELWRAFEERLVLGANCLSDAIAIPHVRSRTVSEIVFAVGRSRTGVEVDETHPSVQLVFLVAAPPDQVNEYLEFMATLSRRLKSPGTLAALLNAGAEDEFRAILMGSTGS